MISCAVPLSYLKGQSRELRMCEPNILQEISRLTQLKKMAAASGFGGHDGKRRNSGGKKTISEL